jgi:hypothetical protein
MANINGENADMVATTVFVAVSITEMFAEGILDT